MECIAAAADATAQPSLEPLRQLALLARDLGLSAVADEAAAFADRVVEGRFFVACVGQCKRGKSSLLNALVGMRVLPTGVTPVTSVVTVVRHGAALGARVRRADAGWEPVRIARLADYVTEERNPGNREQVAGVEVMVPDPLLETGLCLVDTPGVGSVFTASTAATRSFLPHVDAAIVVLGADPPISAAELELIAAVAVRVNDLLVVLSKSDRVPDGDRAEARAFTERMLRDRLGRAVGPILEVSAAERLAAMGPPRGWDTLVGALTALAERSGAGLVRTAEARGLRVLGARVLRDLGERRAALVRPLDESAARIAALRRSVADAERALDDLHHQLVGEHERFARALTERLGRFLDGAVPYGRAVLGRTLASCTREPGGSLHEEAVRQAQRIARRAFERWRAEEAPAAEALYRGTSRRFLEAANAFLERVSRGDAAGVPPLLGDEVGFRVAADIRYTELLPLASPPPLARAVAVLLTRRQRARLVRRRAEGYLARIMLTNAHRVTHGLIEQARESRGRLEADLRRQLGEGVRCAERALEAAEASRAGGAEAIAAELRRLASLEHATAALIPGTVA
jgi:GTP-binding protein EngB required for normal cell division